jgi:hypothetical protein
MCLSLQSRRQFGTLASTFLPCPLAPTRQRQTNPPALAWGSGLAGLRRGTDTRRLPPCAVHRQPPRSEGRHARAPSFAARSQVNQSRW